MAGRVLRDDLAIVEGVARVEHEDEAVGLAATSLNATQAIRVIEEEFV